MKLLVRQWWILFDVCVLGCCLACAAGRSHPPERAVWLTLGLMALSAGIATAVIGLLWVMDRAIDAIALGASRAISHRSV